MSQRLQTNSNDDHKLVDDDRTPLLAATTSAPVPGAAEPGAQTVDSGVVADDDTPLPRLQIFLLCYTRIVEPVAFFSIFPYINFMIENTGGVDKKDVGFYSGLIESLFSLTQMCVMLFWGRVITYAIAVRVVILTFS
jgi:hypothetical protein